MTDKVPPPGPDDPAPEDEMASAQELSAALDDPSRTSADAELARSLRAAWSPQDLPEPAHRALMDQALSQFDARRHAPDRRPLRSYYAGAYARVALALAAGICIAVWAQHILVQKKASDNVTVAVRRSTQPLFHEPFVAFGGETARIDRISMARAADLRDNEFAKWGVR